LPSSYFFVPLHELFTPITPQGHFYILVLTTFTALAIRLSLPVPGISWQPSTFGF
jgi:hypothetical protein